MSKKVTIKEQDIEPEETRDEIIEQVNNTPPPPEPEPPKVVEPPQPQKAEARTRVRELYKCDLCDKYLTKKSLNYSHAKTCKGRPENQKVKEPEVEYEPPVSYETPVSYEPPPPPPQRYVPPPPQMPLYDQMRLERRQAHLNRINRLAQFIV